MDLTTHRARALHTIDPQTFALTQQEPERRFLEKRRTELTARFLCAKHARTKLNRRRTICDGKLRKHLLDTILRLTHRRDSF